MSLDVHVHMGGLPPAKKPIVVSSVFDASVNRMVVTAVFPMRDGKVYVNDERESVQRIVTKAIRSEYHSGISGEAEIANLKSEGERMKAEIARLQGVIIKQGLQAESDTKAVAELTVKVNEQAEFILKQRGRINDLKSRTFAYAYGMGPGQMPVEQFDLAINPLTDAGFVELFLKQPGVSVAQHHDETQMTATERAIRDFQGLFCKHAGAAQVIKLEDPVPMLTLNVAELSAIDIYCQKFGHNVLLQRRNGNLVISSPTGRNPLEVEVYHG